MDFLEGKKTYIAGVLIVIISICYALRLIEVETFLRLIGILVGVGTIALRKAIEKIEKA
jgi:hypothetical protein